MGFQSVRFLNFRNLRDRELALGGREVFLIGENGQGKTNLIESLFLLSFASSFRENRELAFFRDPANSIGLFGIYRDDDREKTLCLRIDAEKKKAIEIDGKIALRSELLGQVLTICFVQQDMLLVSGSPEDRRRFLDQTLVLSDPMYFEALRGYRKVLRARNFVLKQGQEDLLDVYDAQIASLGMELTKKRLDLVRELNTVLGPLFREITHTALNIEFRYQPSWNILENFDAAGRLAGQRQKDLAFGTTTSGPHRDSLIIVCEGREYSTYASTGQTRLCALVLRAVQAQYLSTKTGRKPVLLLDDVLLELDSTKKRAFIDFFPPYEQAFFTFLPDENYLPYRHEETLLLSVEKGDFLPC